MPKEHEAYFLSSSVSVLRKIEARIYLPAISVGLERRPRPSGILEIGIVVAHRGEDDRHSAVMRCGEQRGDNGDFPVEIGAKHRPFVGEVGCL